jgi:hypothetical protein
MRTGPSLLLGGLAAQLLEDQLGARGPPDAGKPVPLGGGDGRGGLDGGTDGVVVGGLAALGGVHSGEAVETDRPCSPRRRRGGIAPETQNAPPPRWRRGVLRVKRRVEAVQGATGA